MTDMGNLPSETLFQSLTTSWESALNAKRPRDVILGGFVAYCYFHDKNDQTFETAALIYVQKAIEELLAAVLPPQDTVTTKPSCSFCGSTEPQVRLAAGAKGFICDSCVRVLGGVFNQ